MIPAPSDLFRYNALYKCTYLLNCYGHKYEVQKINAQLRLGFLTFPGPWAFTPSVPPLGITAQYR